MATHSATAVPSNKDSSLCVGLGLNTQPQANMPPKKKTKKTTKKNPEKSENDLEAKYRRSVLDVAVLQDHIALQCESVKKVQSDRIDLGRCMRHMEQKLQHERQDHRDVHSELSRQYNTMQTELTNKVQRMEKEVSQLSEQLVMCQEELSKETRESEQVEREKDATIADLQHKLDNMETDYERILHENLDSLTSQLSVAQQGWEDKSTTIHQHYKELLSEFGLNARHI